MRESIYNPCFFYRTDPYRYVGIQTNDILILANNYFTSKKEKTIKLAKIMTKNKKYLTSIKPLKFNSAQIKFDSDSIMLTKKVIWTTFS